MRYRSGSIVNSGFIGFTKENHSNKDGIGIGTANAVSLTLQAKATRYHTPSTSLPQSLIPYTHIRTRARNTESHFPCCVDNTALNLKEFVQLPSSRPPARVKVGSELQSTTSFPADCLDCLDWLPCRKVVFRQHETLTFESCI